MKNASIHRNPIHLPEGEMSLTHSPTARLLLPRFLRFSELSPHFYFPSSHQFRGSDILLSYKSGRNTTKFPF
jgi:hypothetical protein